jgi:membrane associated rhomboid family serine protease
VEVTKEYCFLWGHYYCLGRWQWRVSAGSFFSPRRLPNQEPRTNVDPTDDAHHFATRTASWYGSWSMPKSPTPEQEQRATMMRAREVPLQYNDDDIDEATTEFEDNNMDENATIIVPRAETKQHHYAAAMETAYERARRLRERHGHWTHPRTGILSLYCHVTEIKEDLDFAMLYAYNHSDDQVYADFVKKSRRFPLVAMALMMVLVVVFLYEIQSNGWSLESFPDNAFFGPSTETLVKLGAIYTPTVVKDHSFHRFLAAIFLHGGILHLLVHLPLVFMIGGAMERAGHRVLLVLVLCGTGFGANAATATIGEPFMVHSGVSGALCGWYGYCFLDGMLHLHLVTQYRRPTVLFGVTIELTLLFLIGLLPFVDNISHVFGFLSGALLGMVLIPTKSLQERRFDFFWHANRAGLAAAILFCLLSSSMLYLLNAETVADLPCRQCHRFMSCVLYPNYYCDPCRVATISHDRTPGGDYLLHCPYDETIRSTHRIDDIVGTCREKCVLQ